jgi:hypothetical protein
MQRVLAGRPSPAMVVALLALFVALGGTSYAALNLPRNSVGTRQLKKNAVTAAKLHKNAVTSVKVKAHSLLAKDFESGQLPAGPQGPQGPQGNAGPQGATGPTGANGVSVTSQTLPSGSLNCPYGGSSFRAANGTTYACTGAGYQFTTTLGAGPTLTAGTYFVDAEASLTNSTSSPIIGTCRVLAQILSLPEFDGTFWLAASSGGFFSFAGILVVDSTGPLTLNCSTDTSTVPTSNVQWWVSPVG